MSQSLDYGLSSGIDPIRVTWLLTAARGFAACRSVFLSFIRGKADRAPWLEFSLSDGGTPIPAVGMREVVHKSARSSGVEARPDVKADLAGDAFSEFRRLVLPQLDAAYNFARFLARDADAAQDIVQDAFLKAYRGFNGYRGGDARAWLFTIVRNCYHDWQLERRRKLHFEVALEDGSEADDQAIDPASDEDTPEAALIRKTESETVRAVLYSLPRPLREILVLRELEDLSYREIAEVTALPIGTVMSRIARARNALGEAWRLKAGPGKDRS